LELNLLKGLDLRSPCRRLGGRGTRGDGAEGWRRRRRHRGCRQRLPPESPSRATQGTGSGSFYWLA
jgi:hypothetical protein